MHIFTVEKLFYIVISPLPPSKGNHARANAILLKKIAASAGWHFGLITKGF